MRKLLLSTLFAFLMAPALMAADNKQVLNEAGVSLTGYCKAIASAPDGTAYVLMKDSRLVRIDVDGSISEIKIPLNKEIKSMDDYFCDMAVDTKAAYFCDYNDSAIVFLDLNNPKELKNLAVKYDGKEINPMMISKTMEGWTLSDAEQRTFKVDKSGNVTLLPANSQIVLDKSEKAVVSVIPYEENEKTVWPGKLLSEDNSVKWVAPAPQQPQNVMNIEYLGYDSDRSRDVYLVSTASGDCDTKFTVYAIDGQGEVASKKVIPLSNIETLMRFCKLSSDGAVLAAYGDPNDPENKVLLKRFELETIDKDAPQAEPKG